MPSNDNQNIILDGTLLSRLRNDVQDVFNVVDVETPPQAPQGTILFLGDLLMQDSEAAYDMIAERWRVYHYTPMLRRHQGRIALIAQPGVVIPKPSNPWINLVLAIVTILSILLTAVILFTCAGQPQTFAEILGQCFTLSSLQAGLPMVLTIMPILLAHEFGHYFAARYHKVAVTLPYFIPLPFISPVGTLGAFIQLRSPFKTKKQLFDIGVAGPLGGLILAVPLVFWGLANSPVGALTRGAGVLEGNSIFYLTAKYLIKGRLLPNFDQYSNLPLLQEFFLVLTGQVPNGGGIDISLNLVAYAAWFGLFVTAMNLLPVGQLDGGHVVYCLLGDRARWLGLGLIGAMVLAGFWWPGWWLWALLVFFIIGPGHPPPLNDLVPLGLPRTVLAYIMVFLLIILFMPNPLQAL